MQTDETNPLSAPIKKKKNRVKSDKKYNIIPFLISGLIFVGLSVFFLKKAIDEKPEKKIKQTKTEVPFVSSSSVTTGLNYIGINTTGIIKAKWQSKISSQVSGNINFVNPDLQVGNIINKGSTLVEIDDTNYLATLASAKSALAAARTNLATEQARVKQAKIDLARTGIRSTSLALRKPQIEQAKAELESAKASIRNAKKDINRTIIKAPFKSLVISRDISLGELASIGLPITNLADIDSFIATISISEKDSSFLKKKNKYKVIISDNKNKEWETYIDRFSGSFDPNNRTLIAYADINEPYAEKQSPLHLESFVNVKIEADSFDDTTYISNSSIVDNSYVWSLEPNNTIKKTNITIIYSADNKSLIKLSSPITRIINTPLTNFKEGISVNSESEKSKNNKIEESSKKKIVLKTINQKNQGN